MAGATYHNPNVPPIPPPLANVNSLTASLDRVRQGVESLGGIRGGSLDRAVTLQDLITLGLISEAQILALLQGP